MSLKKCLWKLCGGFIIDGCCYKCGRSGDFKYEEYVAKKKWSMEHHNYHSYGGVYKPKGNERRKRNYGTEN